MKLSQVLVVAMLALFVVSAYAGDGTLRFGRTKDLTCKELGVDESVTTTDSEGESAQVATTVDPSCEDPAYAEYYPEECEESEPGASEKREINACGSDQVISFRRTGDMLKVAVRPKDVVTWTAQFIYKGAPYLNARNIDYYCGVYSQGKKISAISKGIFQVGDGIQSISLGCTKHFQYNFDKLAWNDRSNKQHIKTKGDC